MKTLTRITAIALISLLSLKSNAQTFSIKGGVTLANMLIEDEYDIPYNKHFTLGFHTGLFVDIPLNDILSFEPGLLLTTKGTAFDVEVPNLKMRSSINSYYLDVPLTMKLSHSLTDGVKMFAAFGPYVGVGLSGKIKTTLEYPEGKETEEQSIKWGNDKDLKRFDTGLTLGGGVEVNSLLIGVSYDLGLLNINTDDDETLMNRVLKFSVGYLFGS